MIILCLTFEGPPYCSPLQLNHFPFLFTVCESCSFSVPLPALVIPGWFCFEFLVYQELSFGCDVMSHVVLTCISLMVSDSGHPLMCSLAICVSSLEKSLFRPLAHYLLGSFAFLLLSVKSSLHILDINPLSDI